MENYYHLTKKELFFISSEQAPVLSSTGRRLSLPVVVCIFKPNGLVSRVYTLKWFKHCVKSHTIYPDLYEYHICSLL